MDYYDGSEYNGHENPKLSDKEYIQNQLKLAPPVYRDALKQKYSELYRKIISDKSINSWERVGRARYECNTRLRQAVEKVRKTSKPKMKKP